MIAIFDLDETLIHGDCTALWGQWLCEQGYVTDIPTFIHQSNALTKAYEAQILDQQACIDLMFSPIKHLQADEIALLTKQFVSEKIMPIVYREGLKKIEHYKQKGIETIIISASPNLLVKPIAELCFNVSAAFGIEVEIINGFYTGKILGTIPYQAGKITVYEQYITQKLQKMGAESHRAAIDAILATTYFYSDSINDLPLLSKVRYPNTVNPDHSLYHIATTKEWPIYRFAKVA
ncbi:HAD-IB family hydrolase [Ignatzschineria rhizosphaerae]|uniref:HAD-IB family hydrolase n=1 Tax=Ignatzschineria rhizosphaerae TaxID=2923279 RepID=A0ABY3X7P3_9GAMM|nr:HAD-IB family hydrolase [Ignatzschineria rhizosphaerae]UNM97487.1 HAD-IB family hydrolase [Ignatzschineria rhizosphaerae]